MKNLRVVATSLATLFCVYTLGCGSGTSPKILAILPQTLLVGAPPTTMKIQGINFTDQSVVLWNGAKLATTVIDSNTVTSLVPSNNLSTPAVAKVQVRNFTTGEASLPQIVVVAPSTLALATTSLPTATLGKSYQMTLAASAGTAPYTWSVPAGSLPSGLTLNPATGLISGTPTASGNFSLAITVKDSSSPSVSATTTLVLSVVSANQANTAAVLTIPTTTLPAAVTNQAYDGLLTATGGTLPYTWSLSSGSLPAGLSLSSPWGLIYGTPTAGGSYHFTMTVTDSSSPAQTATATISLTITSPPAALTIASSSLPSTVDGQPYTFGMLAMGGTPAYKWSIGAGSLPSGLALGSSSGVISGTPTVSGVFAFTITVTDSGTPIQTKSLVTSITVAAAPLTITTTGLPIGTKGSSYRKVVQATGGDSPYTWAITSGSLPAGLTFGSTNAEIAGAPTVSGNFSIGVTVTDSASHKTNATFKLSVLAPSVPLSISSVTLPAATSGQSYAGSLTASGGASPYTWSIAKGSLPTGLSLSSSGAVTGKPTVTGTFSFTAAVTDSTKPTAESQSTATSITVASAAPKLAIATSALPSGTSGTAYSAGFTATGGTKAYTWSISGNLPAGLTLAATTGIISGTPTASGTFSLTATVRDNSDPVQTASATTSIAIAAESQPTGPGTTWYIRTDGGSRYSAARPTGQCDGKADVAYAGSGTNQHCAFNDFRLLYDDKSYNGIGAGWVIAGGDTVIIRGCYNPDDNGDGATYCRIGTDPPGISDTWCVGGSGAAGCSAGPLPAGTPSQHTRILGQNYASCNTGNATNRSQLTQLFGGDGLGTVINMNNATNVDFECIEITDHADCVEFGSPAYPAACSPGVQDYAEYGMVTNNATSNLLLQDVWIHGLTASGIHGPIGGAITMSRVSIDFNGFAGWNFDDGSSTPDAPGSSINASYVSMIGNGCNEEYPIVHAFPAMSCYDLNSDGFGDSWSGQNTTLASFTCDHCVQAYNTKDGFIGPHTLITKLTVTNSESYGNMGQQWKWGGTVGSTVIFENNLTVGNCMRMSQQLPGAPMNYNESTGQNGAYLSLFCRAAGDMFSFFSSANSTVLIANNTVVGYSETMFDLNCATVGTCGSTPYVFRNNLLLGYFDASLNPTYPQVPGLFYYSDTSDVVTADHNLIHNMRLPSCPTGNICSDPLLVSEPVLNMTSESELDNFNFYPTSGSPVVGAGVSISGVPGLLLDYYGVKRPVPPSIGAVEP